MDKRKQLEELSREMLGLMNDVSAESDIFFPFGYKISPEIEEKYFSKGNNLRLLTSRQMIVVDNSFKKFKIFPSEDIMLTYVDVQKDLLRDWTISALADFKKQNPEAEDSLYEDFKADIRNIVNEINALSVNQIKCVAESDEAKSPDINPGGIKNNLKDFLNDNFLGFFKN